MCEQCGCGETITNQTPSIWQKLAESLFGSSDNYVQRASDGETITGSDATLGYQNPGEQGAQRRS